MSWPTEQEIVTLASALGLVGWFETIRLHGRLRRAEARLERLENPPGPKLGLRRR